MIGYVAPEFENEAVPGLPGPLPEGEYIVWQGSPSGKAVARHVLKARWIAAYFAVIVAWVLATGFYFERTVESIVVSTVLLTVSGLIVYGLARWFGHGVEKTSVYTITNRRVVMRIGIALPTAFNLPFREIRSADLKQHGDGTGDIALGFDDDVRLSWVVFWPHVRGFKMAHTQPQFLCLQDASEVADHLARQLTAFSAREHRANETVIDVDQTSMPVAAE